MERLIQDVRYAFRMIGRNPGFAIASIAILALAIGTTTPTFSMMDAYLLRPLPFGQPERLVHIWGTDTERGWDTLRVSVPDFLDWRRESTKFDDMAGFKYTGENLTGEGEQEKISASRVTANIFRVLRRQPVLGRGFADGDDLPGAQPVVVLSHGFWMSRYRGADDAIGRTIEINREKYTVIGVMPKDFVFPLPTTKFWIPRTLDTSRYTRDAQLLQVVGRLGDGVTRAEARNEMNAIAARLAATWPEDEHRGVNLADLRGALNFADQIFRIMWIVLFAAHAFVLAIACANIAGLFLARAVKREKDVAIRSALGANRRRIVQLLLVETGVLSLGGAVAGLLIALAETRLVSSIVPDELYRVGDIEIGWTAVLFTIGLAVVAAILSGLVPALRASRAEMSDVFRDASGTVVGSRRGLRLQRAFVVIQTSLAVTLLICTGLMIRSFEALKNVDPGFRSGHVLTVGMTLWSDRYKGSDDSTIAFHRDAIARMEQIPGVEKAATVDYLPLNHETDGATVTVPGVTTDSASRPEAYSLIVSPGYFDVLGIPLVAGRDFASTDDMAAPKRVVINETLARRFWPNGTAVGHIVELSDIDGPVEIVGVVGDTLQVELAEGRRPQIFLSQYQFPDQYMRVLVRTSGDPLAVATQAREVIRKIDPDIPITAIRPLADIVDESLLPQMALSASLGVLALGAILLASVGLYGLISFFVSQHKREIGVRLAIGATPRGVLGMVVGRGLKLTLVGIGIGIVGAVVVARLMANLLFGVSSLDPMSFLVVPLLLVVVATLAVFIPARRAASTDPFAILRVE